MQGRSIEVKQQIAGETGEEKNKEGVPGIDEIWYYTQVSKLWLHHCPEVDSLELFNGDHCCSR